MTWATDYKTVDTAGRSVRLSDTSCPFRKCVVYARYSNTGLIRLGHSDKVYAVSTQERGIPLWPGESREFTDDDLRDIWMDAEVDGEGVTWDLVPVRSGA